MEKRGTFGSKLAIILTTAGSAVGLGNIWRFPFMTGQNGGAAFILIYLGCVLILGIPGMISEFVVGRYSQSNAARAYGNVGFRRAKYIGYLGILTSTIILGFYAVVAGWCLQYLYASITGKLERASKLLMPLLLMLLVIIVIASCLLPGASKGIEFLLRPDFSKVSSNVFLEALGQAFFSLSLGTACLCTYASYFKKDTNLVKSATQIALLDSMIAILAGLMIFPAAFSVGVQPDSGPSLIFITLPNVFRQAFVGMPVVGFIIAILFYALLVFAALTSTISMHEIGTAFFHEELHLPRNKAAWILTTVCGLITIFCSLSVGAYSQIQVFGMSLMDFCDSLTAQIMLPTGAFFTSILIGWFVERKLVLNEFTNNGTLKATFFSAYLFSVKFIVPLCILLIFLHQFHII